MLKTAGIFEGVPNGNYKVHTEVATLAGVVPTELISASNLGLQKPYGEQLLGFAAGMVAELKVDAAQNNEICVTISTGAAPCGLFADSYVDCLKSNKGTYYEFFGDYFTDIFDSASSPAYAVNTPLYVVAATTSATAIKGKLTTTAVGKKVGYITQVPDLTNGVLLGFRWQVENL